MLDKSLPYYNIIMKLDKNKIKSINSPILPNGFKFKFFKEIKKDIGHWSRISTSVLDFDSENEAKNFFQKEFISNFKQLKKRCFFIINKNCFPVATSTSWFSNCKEFNYQSILRNVCVSPNYQNLGLGYF
jgi:hypothetical protein